MVKLTSLSCSSDLAREYSQQNEVVKLKEKNNKKKVSVTVCAVCMRILLPACTICFPLGMRFTVDSPMCCSESVEFIVTGCQMVSGRAVWPERTREIDPDAASMMVSEG
jgi:hypothetical protein